jgi:hypothetical protein
MGYVISSWTELTLRYPELNRISAVSSPAAVNSAAIADAQSAIIANAEAYIHSRLASGFSTPFSNTNYTAKDLVIDAAYVQNILSKQAVKGKTVNDSLELRITALLNGQSQMVDVAGTVVPAVGDPAWSNTQDYHPTFGMGDSVVLAVDSQQLIDENNTRGWPIDEAL